MVDSRDELTREQIRARLEPAIKTRTGADHQLVERSDPRSASGVNDWQFVMKLLQRVVRLPPGEGLSEPLTQTTGNLNTGRLGGAPQDVGPGEPSKATTMVGRASEISGWVQRADELLGQITTKRHPMSWLFIPEDKSHVTCGEPLETFGTGGTTWSTMLLALPLRSRTLSDLMGVAPNRTVKEVVDSFGGAGYETNGDLGVISQEHLSFAAVLHEMGHHRQKYDLRLSEENVGQISNLFPILDLHNMLYSENKAALQAIRRGTDRDPVIRLRYTESPVRLPVSKWQELAQGSVVGRDYERLKRRLEAKGGAGAKIIEEIERELQSAPELYPDEVKALFKNMMVKEIFKQNTRMVEPTDEG